MAKSLGMDWHVPHRKTPIGTTTVADGNELALMISESSSWGEVRAKIPYMSQETNEVISYYEMNEKKCPFNQVKSTVKTL